MLIRDWLKQARAKVGSLDADLIALHCFTPSGTDRSWLVAHDDVEVGGMLLGFANRMVTARQEGVPLAYVLSHKEFYGREFFVTPKVLVPRVETEDLIELTKELKLPKNPVFLDVGTGSGCIAITLALEFPQAKVYASDISKAALRVAKKNDLLHEGRVRFVHADLMEGLTNEQFDVVIANLPYVNRNWEFVKMDDLKYEPDGALFVDEENGLGLYHQLFRELTNATYFIAEADPSQHKDLVKMAKDYGWKMKNKRGYGILFAATRALCPAS